MTLPIHNQDQSDIFVPTEPKFGTLKTVGFDAIRRKIAKTVEPELLGEVI